MDIPFSSSNFVSALSTSRQRNARIEISFGVKRFCEDELDLKTIKQTTAAVISFISDMLASITSLICVLVIFGESTVGVGMCVQTWMVR